MSTSELRSGALLPTGRIEAALEHLLDPLDLPDTPAPAEPDHTGPQTSAGNGRAAAATAGVNGRAAPAINGNGRTARPAAKTDAGPPTRERDVPGGADPVRRSDHVSLSDRVLLAASRLRWSDARRYELARIALIALLAGLCGICITLVDSALRGL